MCSDFCLKKDTIWPNYPGSDLTDEYCRRSVNMSTWSSAIWRNKKVGKLVILVNEQDFFLQHDPTYCGEVGGAIDGNGTFWDLNRSMDNYS